MQSRLWAKSIASNRTTMTFRSFPSSRPTCPPLDPARMTQELFSRSHHHRIHHGCGPLSPRRPAQPLRNPTNANASVNARQHPNRPPHACLPPPVPSPSPTHSPQGVTQVCVSPSRPPHHPQRRSRPPRGRHHRRAPRPVRLSRGSTLWTAEPSRRERRQHGKTVPAALAAQAQRHRPRQTGILCPRSRLPMPSTSTAS